MASSGNTRVAVGGKVLGPHMAGPAAVAAGAPPPRPTVLNISLGVSGTAGVAPLRQQQQQQQHSSPQTPLTPIITNGSLKTRLQEEYIPPAATHPTKPGSQSPGNTFASRVASQRHAHYRQSLDQPPKYDDIFCPPSPATTPAQTTHQAHRVIVNNIENENKSSDKKHIKNYFLNHFSKPRTVNKSGLSSVNNNVNMGVGRGAGQGTGVEPCYREIHITPPAGGGQGQAKLNRQLSVSGPTAPAPPAGGGVGVPQQDLSGGYVLGLPVDDIPGAAQGRPFTISLKPGHYRVNVQWRSKQHPFRITLTPRKSSECPPAPPPNEQQPLLYSGEEHLSLPRRLVHRLLFRQPSCTVEGGGGGPVQQQQAAQQQGPAVYPIPLQQYTQQQQQQQQVHHPGPGQPLHHTQSVNCPPLNHHRRGGVGGVPGSPGDRKGLKRGAWSEAPGPGGSGGGGGRHSNAKQRKNRHRWASFSCMHLSSLEESHSETSGPESFSGYEGSEHLARHGAQPPLGNKAQSLETLPSAVGQAAARVAAAAQGLTREAESCMEGTVGGGSNARGIGSGDGRHSGGGGITNNVPNNLSSQGHRVNPPIAEDLQEASVDDDSFIFIEKSQLMYNHAVSCEVLRNEDSDMNGITPSSDILTPRVNRKTWHEDEAFVRQVVDEYFKDPLPLSDEDVLETTQETLTGDPVTIGQDTAGDNCMTSSHAGSDLSDILLEGLSCGSSLSSVHGEFSLSASSTDVEELCTVRDQVKTVGAIISPSIDNTTYCDSDESNSWFTDDSQGYEGDVEPSEMETLLGGSGRVAWRRWRSAPDVRASAAAVSRRQRQHWRHHGHHGHHRPRPPRPPPPAAGAPVTAAAVSGGLGTTAVQGTATSAPPGELLPYCCCYSDTTPPRVARTTEDLPAGDLQILPLSGPRFGYAPRKCLSVGDCKFGQVQRFKKHRLKKFDECGFSDASSRHEGSEGPARCTGDVALIDSNYHDLLSSTAESIFSEILDTTNSLYSETNDASLASSQEFLKHNLNLEFVNKSFKAAREYVSEGLNISENPNYARVTIAAPSAAASESLEFVSGQYRAGLCGSVGRLDVVSGASGGAPAPPVAAASGGRCSCSELLCPCMLRRLEDIGSLGSASGAPSTVDDSTGERTRKVLSNGLVVQNSDLRSSGPGPLDISSSESNLTNKGLLVINSSYKNSELCKSDENILSRSTSEGKVLFGRRGGHEIQNSRDMREEQQRIMANAKASLNLLTPMPYHRPQGHHRAPAAPVGPPGRPHESSGVTSSANVQFTRNPIGEFRGVPPNAPVRTAASMDLLSGSSAQSSPVLRRATRVNQSPCRRTSRDNSATRFHMTSSETSLDSYEKHEQMYENLDGTGRPLMVQSLTNLARGEGLRQGTAAADAMSASVGAPCKFEYSKVPITGNSAREAPPAPKRTSSLEGPLTSSRSSLGESPGSRPNSDTSSSSVGSCCHHTPNPLSRILASRASISSSKKTSTPTTGTSSTSSATTPASVIHIGDIRDDSENANNEFSMHKVQVAEGNKKKFVGATQRTLIEVPLGDPVCNLFDRSKNIKSEVLIKPKISNNNKIDNKQGHMYSEDDSTASYENLSSLKNTCISEYKFGVAPVVPKKNSSFDITGRNEITSSSPGDKVRSTEAVASESKKPSSKNASSKSKSNSSSKSKPRKYFSGILNAIKGGNNSSSSNSNTTSGHHPYSFAASVANGKDRLDMVQEVRETGRKSDSSSSVVPPMVSPRSKRRGLSSPTGSCLERGVFASSHSIDGSKNTKVDNRVRSSDSGASIVFTNSRLSSNDNNLSSEEVPSPPIRRRNYSQPTRTAASTKQQNPRTQSESPRTRRESGPSNLLKTSTKGISSSHIFRRGNNDGKGVANEGLKDIKETSVSQESINSSRESFYSSYEHPSSSYEQQSYENSSDYPSSKGHDRRNRGHEQHPHGHEPHDRHSSGHDRHSSGHERYSSGHERHSSGHERHSSGHERHSSGQERSFSGHNRHSGGFNRHSSGFEHVSNENERHSSGSSNHMQAHEQHLNNSKQPNGQGKSSSSRKHHLCGKEPLKNPASSQHSNSDIKKKASGSSKHLISNHINHEEPKVNSGKCKLSDSNSSFSSGLDVNSNAKKNSNSDSNSKSEISNKDSKWELGSAIKEQLKDLGIDLDVSMKGGSNVLKNDKNPTPALYENLNFLNSLTEHNNSNEPRKDDIKFTSKTNNPGKTNKSTSSHTDSSNKHKSHQRSNKDKNTKSFSSSFASAGGLSDASNANSSTSSGKKDVSGRSGGPQCLGLGGLVGGLDSSATKVSPGGRRRPPMSRPTGLPITPTRSRRSSLSSTTSGGSLSSPTRWRRTIADDIYCGEDSSEEGSREGQLSRSASTGSMVSESTSFYYTAGGSTLYDVSNSKASEFESARNSIATEYASVRESFASDSLYEIPSSVSNDKSNHIPPDPASCESTTVSFTVRTPPSRPKRTISGDYNCDVDVSFSDGEIKVKVRTKEEEANRLHRDKNGKGGRQGKDKKLRDNVQKNNFERDELHSNSDVRLKDINSVDDNISQKKSDSFVHHAVPCVVRSDSSSKSSVSSFRVKESEMCKDHRNSNSEKNCHTNSNNCRTTSVDSENSPLYSNISEVKKEEQSCIETKEQKVPEDPLYVNLRRKGNKESRKNNQDSDSSDTETEDRRTSGVWRHGGDADGESSDGEDGEEESVSPSVHRYFEKANNEPTKIHEQGFRIPRISQPDDEEDDQDEEVDDPAVEVSFDQSTGAPTPPRYASPRPTTPFSNECTHDSNTREAWDAHQGAWDWHRQVWEHHQQVHNQHLQNHNQMQQMHQQQSGLLNDVVTSLGGRWGNTGQYCHGHSPGSLHGSRGSSEDRGISPDRVSLRSSGTTSPCTSKPPPSPLPPSGRPIRDPSSVPRDSSRPTGREDRSCKSRRKARSASAGNKYRVEMEISPQVLRKPRPSSFCNLASRRNHSNSPDPEPVEDDLALQLGLRPEEALYYLSSSGPAPSSLNRRGLAERKKNEGNELYKAKDYREALKLYAEAIKLCPDCAAYYSNRSACYMMLGKYHDALNDAREAVRLDSTFVKGYIRVAKCNIALGDATAALSVLRQASELEPSNRIVRDEITNAQALIRCTEEVAKASDKQDYRTAIFHLDRALELAVGCRALKINKAEFLVFLHRYGDAQEIVNEILQYESSNADAIYVRGLCLYYQDNAEQAFNHFQQVLRFAPDHKKARDIYKKAKVLKQKKEEGNESFKKGEFQSAYNLYTEALAIDPLNKHTNAKLYFNRATVGSKLNNTKGAIDDCTAAINLDEGYLKAYLRRAKCYQQEELHEEAVRDYEKVSKLDRTSEHKRLLHEAKIQLKRSKRKDYYKILGVQKGANEDEIKKSYRKMALVHHPDRHASASDKEKQEHEVKFKEIGEAYAVLTDAKKRAMYDRGQDVNDPDGGFGHDGDIDPNQIFQAFFGGGGHGGFQFSGAHPAFQQGGGGGFPGQGGHMGGNFPGGFHFQFG